MLKHHNRFKCDPIVTTAKFYKNQQSFLWNYAKRQTHESRNANYSVDVTMRNG